jgi:hypothetical protein
MRTSQVGKGLLYRSFPDGLLLHNMWQGIYYCTEAGDGRKEEGRVNKLPAIFDLYWFCQLPLASANETETPPLLWALAQYLGLKS